MGNITNVIPLVRGAGFTAPAPIESGMDLQGFDCGKPALDDWLRFKALKSEGRSARTYVVCRDGTVVGYYCFASGAVRRNELPKRKQSNLPNVVPVFLIGRLAVDKRFQGIGLGKGLLRDALTRATQASKHVGSMAVMVHALNEEAVTFYQAFGFEPFPEAKQTLFLPIETIAIAYDGI